MIADGDPPARRLRIRSRATRYLRSRGVGLSLLGQAADPVEGESLGAWPYNPNSRDRPPNTESPLWTYELSARRWRTPRHRRTRQRRARGSSPRRRGAPERGPRYMHRRRAAAPRPFDHHLESSVRRALERTMKQRARRCQRGAPNTQSARTSSCERVGGVWGGGGGGGGIAEGDHTGRVITRGRDALGCRGPALGAFQAPVPAAQRPPGRFAAPWLRGRRYS